MAQLDFFALRDDIESVIKYVFDETDCRVFEAYSRPGFELREFTSLTALPDSDYLDANGGRYFLRLISRSADCDPILREFTLTKTGQQRFKVEAPAMFQITQGDRLNTARDALSWSIYSHWNEAGAKERSYYSDDVLDAVDWRAMRRVSGRIYRFIKNRLAVAKVDHRPVLPCAFSEIDNGLTLWRGPGIVDRTSEKLQVY